jgi:hypothetical protein
MAPDALGHLEVWLVTGSQEMRTDRKTTPAAPQAIGSKGLGANRHRRHLRGVA